MSRRKELKRRASELWLKKKVGGKYFFGTVRRGQTSNTSCPSSREEQLESEK